MSYLTLADFSRRSVTSSRMLLPGGGVGPGKYDRRAKNIVSSPGLLSRMDWTSSHMKSECGLTDKCVPMGMTDMAIGQPVPGAVTKRYVACTDVERASRLEAARACASRTLATKGGIYSRAA
jgi:hypothetical protein